MSRVQTQVLKVARAIFSQVLSSIIQQLNMMDTQIIDETDQILRILDSHWQGPDAEQFREELKTSIYDAEDIISSMQTLSVALSNAHDQIVDTDHSVAQSVRNLRQVYKEI